MGALLVFQEGRRPLCRVGGTAGAFWLVCSAPCSLLSSTVRSDFSFFGTRYLGTSLALFTVSGGGEPPFSPSPVRSRPPPEPPPRNPAWFLLGHFRCFYFAAPPPPTKPNPPSPPPEPPDSNPFKPHLPSTATIPPSPPLEPPDVKLYQPHLPPTATKPPLPSPVSPVFNLFQSHLEFGYHLLVSSVSTLFDPSPITISTQFYVGSLKLVSLLPCPSLLVRCRANIHIFDPFDIRVFKYLCSEVFCSTICHIWLCLGVNPSVQVQIRAPRYQIWWLHAEHSYRRGGEDFRGILVFWLEYSIVTRLVLALRDYVLSGSVWWFGVGLVLLVEDSQDHHHPNRNQTQIGKHSIISLIVRPQPSFTPSLLDTQGSIGTKSCYWNTLSKVTRSGKNEQEGSGKPLHEVSYPKMVVNTDKLQWGGHGSSPQGEWYEISWLGQTLRPPAKPPDHGMHFGLVVMSMVWWFYA